jgi:hypothetical protein
VTKSNYLKKYDGNGYFVNKTVTPSALYTLAVPSLPFVNTLYKGKKQYELGNHLGNALATISDRRIGIDDNADLIIDYYNPDILSLSDYYAFGSAMPGRSLRVKGYRYGFNTQEKDNEVYGEGNSTSAEFWQYNARLGRRWNVDPIVKYFESSYSCFLSNPIYLSDINGDDVTPKVVNGIPTINATLNVRFDARLGWDAVQKTAYMNTLANQLRVLYGGQVYRGQNVVININVIENTNGTFGLNNQSDISQGNNQVLVDVGIDQPDGNTISKAEKGGGYIFLNSTSGTNDITHEFGHILGLSDRYCESVIYDSDANPKTNNFGVNILGPYPPRSNTIPLTNIKGDKVHNSNTNLMSSPGGNTTLTPKQMKVIFKNRMEREYFRPVLLWDLNSSNNNLNCYDAVSTRRNIWGNTINPYLNGVSVNIDKIRMFTYYTVKGTIVIYHGILPIANITDQGGENAKENKSIIRKVWNIGH